MSADDAEMSGSDPKRKLSPETQAMLISTYQQAMARALEPLQEPIRRMIRDFDQVAAAAIQLSGLQQQLADLNAQVARSVAMPTEHLRATLAASGLWEQLAQQVKTSGDLNAQLAALATQIGGPPVVGGLTEREIADNLGLTDGMGEDLEWLPPVLRDSWQARMWLAGFVVALAILLAEGNVVTRIREQDLPAVLRGLIVVAVSLLGIGEKYFAAPHRGDEEGD